MINQQKVHIRDELEWFALNFGVTTYMQNIRKLERFRISSGYQLLLANNATIEVTEPGTTIIVSL